MSTIESRSHMEHILQYMDALHNKNCNEDEVICLLREEMKRWKLQVEVDSRSYRHEIVLPQALTDR